MEFDRTLERFDGKKVVFHLDNGATFEGVAYFAVSEDEFHCETEFAEFAFSLKEIVSIEEVK